jgi:hypothetical protein
MTRQSTSWQNGEEMITKVYRGPYSQLTTAYEALLNTSAGAKSIVPSVSDGSAIATITVQVPVTFAQWVPLPHEIKPPVYDVIPVNVTLDIRSFFRQSAGVSGVELDSIDKAIRDGTAGSMDVTGYTDGSKKYRLWKLEGINTFDRTTFNLRVQFFFDNIKNIPQFTADYGGVNCVYNWLNIRPLNRQIPTYITEPKASCRWDGAKGKEFFEAAWSTHALLWRLVSVGPQYQGKAASICWEFHGAILWGADFYNGGQWVPA